MPNPWYLGAVHRPVPEASTQGFIKPRLALIHTNAGTGHTASLYGWILNPASNGMECHFQVALSGVIEQYMPVNRRADCNYRVNSFVVDGVTYGAISFETEDLGAATVNQTPLTAAQFEAIAKCLAWLHAEWGLSLANPTVWNGEGVGYHTQFPYPYWTNVIGKTCPGAAKKAQLPSLRSRAVVLAGIAQPPPPYVLPAPTLPAAYLSEDAMPVYVRGDGPSGPPNYNQAGDYVYVVNPDGSLTHVDGAKNDVLDKAGAPASVRVIPQRTVDNAPKRA